MNNHDDKYPSRPGFEPPGYKPQYIDTDKPSGPACWSASLYDNNMITLLQLIQENIVWSIKSGIF